MWSMAFLDLKQPHEEECFLWHFLVSHWLDAMCLTLEINSFVYLKDKYSMITWKSISVRSKKKANLWSGLGTVNSLGIGTGQNIHPFYLTQWFERCPHAWRSCSPRDEPTLSRLYYWRENRFWQGFESIQTRRLAWIDWHLASLSSRAEGTLHVLWISLQMSWEADGMEIGLFCNNTWFIGQDCIERYSTRGMGSKWSCTFGLDT